jgi:hypothetical protein
VGYTVLIHAWPVLQGAAALEIFFVLKSQPSGALMPMGTEKVTGRTAITGENVGLVKTKWRQLEPAPTIDGGGGSSVKGFASR